MKKTQILPQLVFSFLLIFSLMQPAVAQEKKAPASPKATVSQSIGTDGMITIAYSRPSVKGREVYGKIVPYGMEKGNQYSNNKDFPWRAGANENTTFEVNQNVKINGKPLPAGKYSIHMIPAQNSDWTLIFNKVSNEWGSYKYDQGQDALRVTTKPIAAPMTEMLSYGFDEYKGNATTAYLQWEKLRVPFTVEL